RDRGGRAVARGRRRLAATVDPVPTGPEHRLMPERGRSPRESPVFALAIALWAVVAAQPARGAVASTTWRLDVAPTTIAAADPTTIDVTFSNRGGTTGDEELGCARP